MLDFLMGLIRAGSGVALAVLATSGLVRGDDVPKDLAEIKAKYQVETEAHRVKYKDIGEVDRPTAINEYWAMTRTTAHRAFDYVRTHPDAPDSLDAAIWVVEKLANSYDSRLADEVAEAYRILLERGLDSDRVIGLAYRADRAAESCPEARRFLEVALEHGGNRALQGVAGLALARADRNTAAMSRAVRDPITGPDYAAILARKNPDYLARVMAVIPTSVDARAEAMFERVVAEYADARLPGGQGRASIGDIARGELHALRHLSIGRVAPEITAEDVRGGPVRLSDHKGKVVAVIFWATWCGPCMADVPGEHDLIERMAGRPFVLFGVNGDDDRAKAGKVMAERKMTWPSAWNGGVGGGIVEEWGVRAWPTVYVIDARGEIRYQDVRGEYLDRTVEHLVAEAEAKAATEPIKPVNSKP